MLKEPFKYKLKPGSHVIRKTISGKSANLGSLLENNMFLSYVRAPVGSGVDLLALVDLCIVQPSRDEFCPPTFSRLQDPLNKNTVRSLI
ncbi:unnamed protein product [Protopolystoma xenopodis]|uniref:MABP domain-containing protein n=1 Tax=Protopolystoma xenopodis TaxID=117903 RepID=A0A448WKL1_9PLAT|nr:unnamed protein product [Protopolystoma xenopodis]